MKKYDIGNIFAGLFVLIVFGVIAVVSGAGMVALGMRTYKYLMP